MDTLTPRRIMAGLGIIGGVLFFGVTVTYGPTLALALLAIYTALAAAACQCYALVRARRLEMGAMSRLAREADRQHAALLGGDYVTGMFGDKPPPEEFIEPWLRFSTPIPAKKKPSPTLWHHVLNMYDDCRQLRAISYQSQAQYDEMCLKNNYLREMATELNLTVDELIKRARQTVSSAA